MSHFTRNTVIRCGAVAALALGSFVPAVAAGGPEVGPHGGTLAKAGSSQFEVLFTGVGVEVYPLTPNRGPVPATGLSGKATFFYQGAAAPWFSCPLRPAAVPPSRLATSLVAVMGLGAVPAQGVTVTFHVAGLPGPGKTDAEFTVPFRLAPTGALQVARATQADREAFRAQRYCKVGGGEFEWSTGPVKVTRGDRSVFVCCEDCAEKVQKDPDNYFGSAAPGANAGYGPGHHH
jgi:hypothetical protein